MSNKEPQRLSDNFYANIFGVVVVNVVNFLAIPLYLKYAGIEAYGLIGFFASLQAFITFFFSGLGTAFNRGIAQASGVSGHNCDLADLIASSLRVYLIASILVLLLLLLLSAVASEYWISNEIIPKPTIRMSFALLSISMFFSMLASFYTNGLLGAQSHVSVNALLALQGISRAALGVTSLVIFNGDLISFLASFVFVSVIHMILSRYFFRKKLNVANLPRGRVVKKVLEKHAGFTLSLMSIGFTAMVISQMDKFVLSRVLPLAEFGAYVVAGTFGILILQISAPFYNSFFPKLVQKRAAGLDFEYSENFTLVCRLLAITIWPIILGILFFGETFLLFWLRDPILVGTIYYVVCFLIFGSGFNALLSMIYMHSLVHGSPKPFLYQNLILVFVMPFLLTFAASQHGMVGAAATWALINLVSLCVMPLWINYSVMKFDIFNWVKDSLASAIFSFLFLGSISLIQSEGYNNDLLAIWYGLAIISCSLLMAISMPNVKRFILRTNLTREMK